MKRAGPVQVSLEIERVAETVGGQLAIEGAAPRRFFGWLELIDRLERAATAGPAQLSNNETRGKEAR